MTKAKWALSASILIFLAAGTVPAMAADAPDRDFSAPSQTVPEILSAKQKQFYTQVLTAIRGQRWADAKSMLDGAENGPLNDFLRAE
ncbi:MAG TPA: lytic transglycosylase domain-containing protein, partial [Sphingopyxis terrae]|nr:lytic transglycosylase domain-containing protein [Sphingopyxis terrae]